MSNIRMFINKLCGPYPGHTGGLLRVYKSIASKENIPDDLDSEEIKAYFKNMSDYELRKCLPVFREILTSGCLVHKLRTGTMDCTWCCNTCEKENLKWLLDPGSIWKEEKEN